MMLENNHLDLGADFSLTLRNSIQHQTNKIQHDLNKVQPACWHSRILDTSEKTRKCWPVIPLFKYH
jgi:hypothetical protein